MKQPNVKIGYVSTYLPQRTVTNAELEQLVNQKQVLLPLGVLEKLFGIRERRFADSSEQASDIAAKAALPIVEAVGKTAVDYLIFAGACSDLIEPATANIVQHKLGLDCPAFDLKNACNSFVDGITVAASLIQSGQFRNVLIATGEKLSDAIRLDGEHSPTHLAAFSLGDAGAAMLLTPSENGSGIHFQKKLTRGQHWELCTIRGGGSMHPREPEKNYFEGSTAELKSVISDEGVAFVRQCYEQSGWSPGMVDHVFTHQVSAGTFRVVEQATGVPAERIASVFETCGNTAAASIPLALHQALQAGKLRRGDRVMLFGIGAGFSLSIQLLTW
jgi:3-oxoacyl-[acyl-carrier-protein] synthase-3